MSKPFISLSICLFTMIHVAFAQQLSIDLSYQRNASFGTVNFFDPAKADNKKVSTMSYADVDGSPFIHDQWSHAVVYLKSGKSMLFPKARLNSYTGELHYLATVGVEMAIEPDKIDKFVIFDAKDSTKTGSFYVSLPDHIDSKPFAFFRVFNNGIYQLVSLQKTMVKTSPYDPIEGKKISSFFTKTYYAIYNNGRVIPIKGLDHSVISEAIHLSDQDEKWLKQMNIMDEKGNVQPVTQAHRMLQNMPKHLLMSR